MALGHFQQTAQTVSGCTLIGGWKMARAATSGSFAGATAFGSGCTILGIGNLTGFTENIEMSTTQAGNSNMPEKVVAVHTATLAFELLEFHLPTFDEIRGGGLDTEVEATASTYLTGVGGAGAGSAGTVNTISTGGLNTVNESAFAFYNVRMDASTTVETILVVHKARISAGLTFTPKTDHDTDAVTVFPFTLEAELDTTNAAGSQLYTIETELGESGTGS